MSQPTDPNQTVDAVPQPIAADDAAAPPTRCAATAGLELLEKIARGGMGDVLKGRDVELGRDVAVKVLREDRRDQIELGQRFLEEARIAGRLQHPGVVPVYSLGWLPDGRPYFTMKLVKGRTLAELLAERKEPGQDRPRWMAVFEQVCQTLAYAHSKGVIHRDLKPSNVMVGAFGEVQVMDWGLAKVLPRDGATVGEPSEPSSADVSVIQTPRGEASDTGEEGSETRAGSVLGTPSYMAPEQARGEVEDVDRRSDVFGLGAILCEVLTGRPPFAGSGAAAQKRAARADLADAFTRLDGCGADAELIALAKRCLAAKAEERPRDAAETAAAVTAHRESVERRLREAEVANAAEVARTKEARATAAQERRARRFMLGLAASLLTLVTAAAAGGLWVQRQWAAQAAATLRQREAVESALEKTGELRKQSRWAEMHTVLEQTRDRLGEAGPADLRQRVEQAMADVELVDRLEAIRMKRLALMDNLAAQFGQTENEDADKDYAAAFREAGLGAETEDAKVVAERIRASAVGDHLVAALDDWAAVTWNDGRRTWLSEVARRADPDPWRDRFRDFQVWSDRAKLEALAKELLTDEKLLARQKPQLLAALGAALRRVQADAVPLLRAAQARHPDDFWLNFDLAHALENAAFQPGAANADNSAKALDNATEWGEIISFYQAALALRPSAASVHHSIARALFFNDPDEAIRQYRIAIELDPKDAETPIELADFLISMSRGGSDEQIDEQIKDFRRAIDIDPKNRIYHMFIASLLRSKGQLDEAIKVYCSAIDLDPKDSWPHQELGDVFCDKKQMDEAIKEYRIAVSLDPKETRPHCAVGDLLRQKEQWDEAIKEYHLAIDQDPKDATPHSDIGDILRDKGQFSEAIKEYRVAIALSPKDAGLHDSLAYALNSNGQLDVAIKEYRVAVDLEPKNAWRHARLGTVLNNKGQSDEAIKEFHLALDLTPKDARLHDYFGGALNRNKQFDEAIKEYCLAIDLNPKEFDAYTHLGVALRNQGKLDELVTEFRAFVKQDGNNAAALDQLGWALRLQKKLYEALTYCKKAVELQPTAANFHNSLAYVLWDQGKLDEAAAEFREAVRLDPHLVVAFINLGHVLQAKGNLEESRNMVWSALMGPIGHVLQAKGNLEDALACYKKALELNPNDAGPRYELVKVLAPLGRLEEARAAWAAALDHDPPSHDAWFGYAELCLFLGRDDEYRRSCRALLDRFGNTADPAVAERTGRVLLLLPISGDDLERGAALADRAAAAGPKHPYYAYFMATKGLAEYRRGRFDAAIDALQQAGARGVWMPATRPVLAMALYRSGRTQEARESLAAAVQSYDWNEANADFHDKWIAHILRREAEELIVPNLPAFLKGEYQPKDNSERLELIDPCRFRKRYLAASRLYADALAADPKLADDALSGNRYNAACAAARAGCGQGEGAKDLDAKERARWRKQGLDWLRADLALWGKQFDSDKPEERKTAVEKLRHWQEDSDLASLRDAAELARLPADEQEACKKLWGDVKTLLDKAEAKK